MENNFINGLIIKKPRQGSKDFVKAHLSMKVADLKKWLDEQYPDEWVNADILETKAGDRYYAKLDTYVPKQSNSQPAPKFEAEEVTLEDVPF